MPEARTGAAEQRLGAAADVPEGGARGYDPAGHGQDTLFAVRHRGRLHLWRDRCPHAGTPMAWRRHAYLDAAGARIVCAAPLFHLHQLIFGTQNYAKTIASNMTVVVVRTKITHCFDLMNHFLGIE